MPIKCNFVVAIREVILIFDIASRVRNAQGARAFVGICFATYYSDAAPALLPLSLEGSF